MKINQQSSPFITKKILISKIAYWVEKTQVRPTVCFLPNSNWIGEMQERLRLSGGTCNQFRIVGSKSNPMCIQFWRVGKKEPTFKYLHWTIRVLFSKSQVSDATILAIYALKKLAHFVALNRLDGQSIPKEVKKCTIC